MGMSTPTIDHIDSSNDLETPNRALASLKLRFLVERDEYVPRVEDFRVADQPGADPTNRRQTESAGGLWQDSDSYVGFRLASRFEWLRTYFCGLADAAARSSARAPARIPTMPILPSWQAYS
jgi:hypothetical protein